ERHEMTRASLQKRRGYIAIGGIGTFLAAGYLGMAIQLPFGQLDQPGAAVFPIIAGALFMFGSLAALWEGWKTAPAEQIDIPAGADLARLLSLIGLLLCYLVLLPWVGQLISSFLFCALLMRLLCDLAWPRMAVYSVIITSALY